MPILKDYGESKANLPTAQDDYIFTRANGDKFVICDLYLESIFDAVNPEPGGWKGLFLEYHCNLDWLEEGSYRINDISEFINQLKSIPTNKLESRPFGAEASNMLPELLFFLSVSSEMELSVHISRV